MTLHEEIRTILQDAGLAAYADDGRAEAFRLLLTLLTETNKEYNLTAITEPREIILRHFADSLTAAKEIPASASVVDVGCGGGFPSLPLAIARPDIRVTALDSTAKKLAFVEKAAAALSLGNLTTVAVRAEEYRAGREAFDVAVSRAVARMNLLTELCLPLVRVGGLFLAMKGADGPRELAEAEAAIARLGGQVKKTEAFTLLSAGERFLITVEKTAPTPAGYPRPFGKIKKKPL